MLHGHVLLTFPLLLSPPLSSFVHCSTTPRHRPHSLYTVAAHLRGRGIVPQVFGAPMSSWCRAMPSGMRLKSEPFASSLSDPKGELTLGAYCRAHGLPYADLDMPVPVETFAAYGVAFARRVNDLIARDARTAPGT